MKTQFAIATELIILVLVASCESSTTVVQRPVPNSDECYFFIPVNSGSLGGNVAGSISATGLPGVSAGGNIATSWGYSVYVGKCTDPKNAKLLQIPAPAKSDTSATAAAKPASSPTKSGAPAMTPQTKKPTIQVNVDGQLTAMSAQILSHNDPALLLSKAIPVYEAINAYAQLRPVAQGQPSAPEVISSLKSIVQRSDLVFAHPISPNKEAIYRGAADVTTIRVARAQPKKRKD
jgi:hypothetical protein